MKAIDTASAVRGSYRAITVSEASTGGAALVVHLSRGPGSSEALNELSAFGWTPLEPPLTSLQQSRSTSSMAVFAGEDLLIIGRSDGRPRALLVAELEEHLPDGWGVMVAREGGIDTFVEASDAHGVASSRGGLEKIAITHGVLAARLAIDSF